MQGGHRFYFNFEGAEGLLPLNEAHHAVMVLRKKVKDIVLLINGKGEEYVGQISEIKRNRGVTLVKVRILELLRKESPPRIILNVFLPLLKGDRTDFLIEKGTELGVNNFTVYQSKHTIPKISPDKILRFKEKSLNALKQSGRLYLPTVTLSTSLIKTLKDLSPRSAIKILAHPKGDSSLKLIAERLKENTEEIILLSGPEGDLSQEEFNMAIDVGFLPISLSPYILKAETASLSLIAIVTYLIKEFHNKTY
ncbi:MAG: RsmE family RNA methyltransferase [Caldimicrobium sp.]|nr:16S rRNA (uracil(1498)-N(3))-methyltransferase [Caldimicrobium sp.]MDW8182150.1 RsmE family RNA methyltransferase [Caldimicrobium sp.]